MVLAFQCGFLSLFTQETRYIKNLTNFAFLLWDFPKVYYDPTFKSILICPMHAHPTKNKNEFTNKINQLFLVSLK